MDAACDAAFGPSILPAFLNGTARLAAAQQLLATRYLSQVLYAGVLDPPSMNPYSAYGPERIDTAASRTLAFEAAVQSIVLLKNDGGLLPLASSKSLRRLAVVGPNAASTKTLLSNYHGETPVVNDQSVLQSLQRRGDSHGFVVDFVPGCASPAVPQHLGLCERISSRCSC